MPIWNNLPCYVCGEQAVQWDADFDGEELGMDSGVCSEFHCRNCGAEITVFVRAEDECSPQE